jgi:superfamily I DNA/RNA helicase
MPGLGSLQQFVAYASLMADNTDTESEAAKEEGDGRVQLMTLHASKGKEFPMVVIPNVVDGSLPSGR